MPRPHGNALWLNRVKAACRLEGADAGDPTIMLLDKIYIMTTCTNTYASLPLICWAAPGIPAGSLPPPDSMAQGAAGHHGSSLRASKQRSRLPKKTRTAH